jgi:hypothetical protein
MGVLSVDTAWEEEARIEQSSREWRAGFKVLCSDVNDGPKEVLQGCPTLAPYQPHPKDPAALVAEFWPKRIKGSNWHDLEIRWSTDVDVSTSPLTLPPVITIDSTTRSIPTLFDIDGNPIVNMAGDPYTDPVSERLVVDKIFKVSKNLPLVLPDWTDTHVGAVNNDSVRIRGRNYDPGTLFFGALSIGPEQNVPGSTDTISTLLKGTPYTTADFELWYRAQGWTLILPNWGYFELVPTAKQQGKIINLEVPGAGAKKIRVRSIPAGFVRRRILVGPVGDFPSQPVYLDVNGRAIINPSLDQIVTLQFDTNYKQAFSQLPLK